MSSNVLHCPPLSPNALHCPPCKLNDKYFVFRSIAKSPLLQEPKLLPPEPSASNHSEVEEEEEEDEEEDDDEEEEEENVGPARPDNDYVAAVCQYTTVLKETPPGFDDNKYEVNFMNLEQGTTEERKAEPTVKVSEDEERRKLSPRLIEYCDDEEECDDEANIAVSGKLAIHLDTGETSREFCLNRFDESSGRTRDERSHTREESLSCNSELERGDNREAGPLFIKKYQGRFFQTDFEPSDKSDVAPVPPPRSKSKETSSNLQSHQERRVE